MPRSLPPSFFRLQVESVPQYPPLAGSRRADVCVVGGGFTGLSAALHLAEAGADVVLVEANEIASGASGRNGGQIHSGLRRDVLWLEEKFGFERARILWDMSEEAKALLRSLIIRYTIACDLRAGVIETFHKRSLMQRCGGAGEGAERALWLRPGDAARSRRDDCGTRLRALLRRHPRSRRRPSRPLSLLAGPRPRGSSDMAPRSTKTHRRWLSSPGPVVTNARGEIRAERVIVATDGRSGSFEQITRTAHGRHQQLCRRDRAARRSRARPSCPADSRRPTAASSSAIGERPPDGRLVFGGGESNAGTIPADVRSFVRPHLVEIYPHLARASLVHGWGGIVSVTAPRLPFVREIFPNVWAAGGYSGQGVALAPFVGKLLAEAVQGKTDRINVFAEFPIPTLPLATWLRRSLVTLAIWRGRLADRL